MEHSCGIIVIGGSAGSIPVTRKILQALRPPFHIPVVICLHRMKNVTGSIREVLETRYHSEVIEPDDKDPVMCGKIYLAPSNYHLLINNDLTFSLSTEAPVNYSRPAIDLMFSSAVHVYGDQLTAVLLSGANSDGANGIKEVKKKGGTTIVQNPAECQVPVMPLTAIQSGCVDYIFRTAEIADYMNRLNSIRFAD